MLKVPGIGEKPAVRLLILYLVVVTAQTAIDCAVGVVYYVNTVIRSWTEAEFQFLLS